MLVSDFIEYLEQNFPTIKFYNGTINRNEPCVGVYLKGSSYNTMALGGPDFTSYEVKPLILLIHWTDDAKASEIKSRALYKFLLGKSNLLINGHRIITFQLLDSGPIDISRDENNICELVIRLNLIHDKEVI